MSPPPDAPLPDTLPRGERTPSPTARTIITLLLITHFTALAIALATNARPLSPIRNALNAVRVFRPYLDGLHMNLAYNFHLTDGSEQDIDHFFEFSVTDPGDTEPQTLPLLGGDAQPGIRRHRYMQFALASIPEEGQDPILAHAVARAVLAERGIDSGRHRLRIVRRTLVLRDNADHPDRSISDPRHPQRWETAYAADLLCGMGEVSLLRVVDESQRAEVREPRGRRP